MNWAGFEAAISVILGWIKNNNKQYTGVYGVPRGGLVPAIRLSHELDIPLLMGGVTERSLCVDDIADSGNVIRPFMERSKCDVVTLYLSKHSQLKPTFWAYETSNWIVFPWEKYDS